MTDTRIVKVESILESQIPSFLASDSPLFKEFLTQYYISQTHSTGTLDFANNLTDYKNISTYASEKLYSLNNTCYLIEDVYSFDDEIEINSAVGFPDKYGLIQIDNEIITYTGISEENFKIKFTGCIRGFSGVSKIDDTQDISGLTFSTTFAEEHLSGTVVRNLNSIFYEKLFQKFKSHYLPDFENRDFNSKIDLELVLSRAKDFYLTKGTDASFKILFDILYDDVVSVIKPQEYIIRSSDNPYLITKNILVEQLFGTFIPSEVIGYTISQDLPSGVTASAAIYNIEYRPTDEFNLYEISLDSESFVYNFNPTKKTTILEIFSDSIIVDSTIGFKDEGKLYVKIKNENQTFTTTSFYYSGKTINKFLNITEIDEASFSSIKIGDDVIEDNLLQITLDDTSTVQFRLLNVIENFDYSNTNTIKVGDVIFLSSFGENYTDSPEFTSWIYNYPTYHDIKSVDSTFIELKDSVNFILGDMVELIDQNNNSITTEVVDVISENNIQVDSISGEPKVKLKRKIIKNNLINTECVNIQNTYFNETNNSVVVASSGLPVTLDLSKINLYSFILTGVGATFASRKLDNSDAVAHNLLSGNKIYINSNNTELSTGQYFVKKVDDYNLSLYRSTGDLYLSFAKKLEASQYSNPISIKEPSSNNIIGIATVFGYENAGNNLSNQLLLKEFKVQDALYANKINSSSQIYTIGDAYNAFS
jgi:hypothetical protein